MALIQAAEPSRIFLKKRGGGSYSSVQAHVLSNVQPFDKPVLYKRKDGQVAKVVAIHTDDKTQILAAERSAAAGQVAHREDELLSIMRATQPQGRTCGCHSRP